MMCVCSLLLGLVRRNTLVALSEPSSVCPASRVKSGGCIKHVLLFLSLDCHSENTGIDTGFIALPLSVS